MDRRKFFKLLPVAALGVVTLEAFKKPKEEDTGIVNYDDAIEINKPVVINGGLVIRPGSTQQTEVFTVENHPENVANYASHQHTGVLTFGSLSQKILTVTATPKK